MSVTAKLRELQQASPRQLAEGVQRTLPYGVSVLLVIAIAWQLVQLTWLLIEPAGSNVPTQPAGTVAPRPQPIDIQRIARARLFGAPEAAAPSQDDLTAPQTQLNLRLAGTIASDDPAKGYAIIGESGGSAKFYSTGDALPGGVRLHSVYADRVILDRNGQLEALSLPRSSPQPVARVAPPPQPQPSQFAENLRRLAETNPGALAEVIRPQPVFAGGVQRGYRVYPGRNRQQFAQLGLRPGDLILAINGTPLDDPNRGAEIFSTLGSSGRVTVSIERNGQTQELTLNTAQISLPSAEPTETEGAPGGGTMGDRQAIVPPQ
jgi:general secretion pathway protein C